MLQSFHNRAHSSPIKLNVDLSPETLFKFLDSYFCFIPDSDLDGSTACALLYFPVAHHHNSI